MKKLIERNPDNTQAEQRQMPWLMFGIPVGCGFGVVFGNLALGIGLGLLLGGTITAFTQKKEGQKISLWLKIVLAVVLIAILALGIVIKK